MAPQLGSRDRLAKARYKLARSEPFFAYLAFQMTFREEPAEKCPTMGVDQAGVLHYNDEFIQSHSDDELLFDLVHETLHCAFLHNSNVRKGARNTMKWNIAGDFVVNAILKENNIGSMSKDSLYDVKFKDMTIEQVYDKLGLKIPETQQPQMGKGGCYQEGREESVGEGEGIDWKAKVSEAAASARMQGKTPLGMDRLIEDLHHKPVNWRDFIQSKFQQRIITDYSYRKHNRRSTDESVLPGAVKSGTDVLVGIDTSGSISPQDLSAFYSEIKALQESCPGTKMTIVCCDTQVYPPIEAESWDELKEKIHFKGGGGTDFRPVFEFLKKMTHPVSMVIMLTDGDGEFPKENPGVETIWVSCSKKFDVPFGTVVKMNDSR